MLDCKENVGNPQLERDMCGQRKSDRKWNVGFDTMVIIIKSSQPLPLTRTVPA